MNREESKKEYLEMLSVSLKRGFAILKEENKINDKVENVLLTLIMESAEKSFDSGFNAAESEWAGALSEIVLRKINEDKTP